MIIGCALPGLLVANLSLKRSYGETSGDAFWHFLDNVLDRWQMKHGKKPISEHVLVWYVHRGLSPCRPSNSKSDAPEELGTSRKARAEV